MKSKVIILTSFLLLACGNVQSKKDSIVLQNTEIRKVPQFEADSAYFHIEKQLSFGPRVPQTKAHNNCSEYLLSKLSSFCDAAQIQQGMVELYNGEVIPCKNIIGIFSPEKKSRILLCAHWDSRPFSDQESDVKKQKLAVSGADDGASGVAVLLEMARLFSIQKPNVGVDIVLFDVEDYGKPDFYTGKVYTEHSWCLGSQYWSKNPHKINYTARYGILLDMVGANGATFRKEQFSNYYAANIVNKVWNEAKKLGFSSCFLDEMGGAVTDDHLYVNQLAEIPCIDIIRQEMESETGFATYWHTQEDDMRNISKETLYKVGQTLLSVIYSEK